MGKNKYYPQERRNMGFYLDSAAPKTLYRSEVKSPYFVDKSMVLKELFQFMKTRNKHICYDEYDCIFFYRCTRFK